MTLFQSTVSSFFHGGRGRSPKMSLAARHFAQILAPGKSASGFLALYWERPVFTWIDG
jgi:hypothetical protein